MFSLEADAGIKEATMDLLDSHTTSDPTQTTIDPTTDLDWTDRVSQLLGDWHRRVYAAQSAHYASADLFRKLNYAVGVPTIIFASIVGTAIFAGLEKDTPRAFAVAAAVSLQQCWLDSKRSCVSRKGPFNTQPQLTGIQLSDAKLSRYYICPSSAAEEPRIVWMKFVRR